jgi:single-strand DNA-binding protein
MNISIILGRLTKTPEIKTSANGTKLLNFTLAVNKKYKDQDQTSYINCVAFNKTAEIIAQYTEKGSKVIVEGEIQTRSYDKDGIKVYTTEIITNQITIIDFKSKDAQQDAPVPQSSPRSDRLNQHKETIEKRLEESKQITIDSDLLPF